MAQPINYLGLAPQIDLGQSLAQGLMNGEAIQAARQRREMVREKVLAAREARERKALFADRFNAWLENPTAKGWAELAALDPSRLEALKAGAAQMDAEQKTAAIKEKAYVLDMARRNDREGLKKYVEARLASNPDDADDIELLAALENDQSPDLLKRIGGFAMAELIAFAGPEKVAEAYPAFAQEARSEALHPAAVREAEAKATTAEVEADYAPKKAEADLQDTQSQIQFRADQTRLGYGRISLDRDRLDFDIRSKIDELRNKGAEIDPTSSKILSEAVAASQEGFALARQAYDLADRFEASDISGWGVGSGFREFARGAWGGQDAVSDLRKAYVRLRSSAVIKNLPPGSASDTDVKTVLQGFPPETAGREHITRFLRGMAKLEEIKANTEAAKADWISENGNLGKAKRDLIVNGTLVAPGTSFAEFSRSGAAIRRGGELPPDISSVLEVYRP